MKQSGAQPIRPTGSPSNPRYEPIPSAPTQIPEITLTQPTPPSSAIPKQPQNQYQLPAYQTRLRPAPPAAHQTPPLRTAPRPAEDYQAMLTAMASGNFDVPVFGEAGAVFHREGGVETPRIPRKKVGGEVQKPMKRKRKGDEEGAGGLVKKAGVGRGKKEM